MRQHLRQGRETAFLDVRDAIEYAEGHAFGSVSVPLPALERKIAALVPRLDAPIVLLGDTAGRDKRAAQALAQLGYRDITILSGGLTAWSAAGGEVFWGTNVACKAFGAWVADVRSTPLITAPDLKARIDAGDDLVVIDVGPATEAGPLSIPGAVKVAAAEILYRLADLAPSPRTTIVTASGGHARSIIMAQLLIDAGVPNPVAALQHGIIGWSLAGHPLAEARTQPPVSSAAVAAAQTQARRLADKAGVVTIDRTTLEQWRRDDGRTLYEFDVRGGEEHRAGLIPGFRPLPSDRLLPLVDQQVGVAGARLVLADLDGVRALVTAAGLRQMGWQDVVVLGTEHAHALGPLQAGTPDGAANGTPAPAKGPTAPPPAEAVAAYSAWEQQVIAQLRRDGLTRYRAL